ncbi:hypothetical protein M2G70_07360 [Vibrio vulnificus]|nr:hypothetical protein [Vibrio vulnificus]
MTKLLNRNLKINVNTLTCSLEELQIQLEQENKEKAFNKFMDSIKKAKDNNQNDSLPSYNNLLKKLFLDGRAFWDEQYTLNITTKAKKKALWNNLIKPTNEAYNAIIQDNSKAQNYTTEPRDLIPYFVAQEILEPLFTSKSVQILSVTTKVANRVTTAYRLPRIEEDSDSPLLIGVLEFIRSVAILSSLLETQNSTELEVDSLVEVKRGNHLMLSSEVANSIIETLDETVASSKNIFEPMIVQPIPHKNLHDKEGGYLTVNSELHKHFYGANTSASVFNTMTRPEYFKTKNELQNTAYSVNTNLLEFIDALNSESPKLLQDHLLYDYTKEKKEFDSLSKKLKPTLLPMRKKEKELWKTYYKKRDFINNLKDKIEEQGNPTEAQLKQAQKLSSEIIDLLSQCNEIQKEIEETLEPLNELQSRISKSQANRRTLDIAVKYSGFKSLYFPIFVGANDRTYYYSSSFNPQGNNLCKSLISFADSYRMTEEGFESFKFCFGTIFNGFDKKVKSLRVKAVEDNHEAIVDFIERRSNHFLSLVDSDEIFTAIAFAIEYYNHLVNPDYETKVICYVDAASSGVQIQGLTQRCDQCLTLTSVVNPEGDTLADAYQVPADSLKQSAGVITSLSDAELLKAIDNLF